MLIIMKKVLSITLLLALLLPGCMPVEEGFGLDSPGQYSRVYIALAYRGVQKYDISAPGVFPVKFFANYSGLVPLHGDLTVSISTDMSLVDGFNERMMSHYLPLPEKCFSITVPEVVIPAGATISSSTAQIDFLTDQFDDNQEYLLPVTAGAADGSVGTEGDLRVLYIAVICRAEELRIQAVGLPEFEVLTTEEW